MTEIRKLNKQALTLFWGLYSLKNKTGQICRLTRSVLVATRLGKLEHFPSYRGRTFSTRRFTKKAGRYV